MQIELPNVSAGLVDALISEHRQYLSSDPERAVRIAAQAAKVADSLPRDGNSRLIRDSARVRSIAWLGNAHRRAGNLALAERHLDECDRIAVDGWAVCPDDLALVQVLRGALLNNQQHHHAALMELIEAEQAYREIGAQHQLGEALIWKGVVLLDLEAPRGAIRSLDEALLLIDDDKNPRTRFLAFQNLALAYVRWGSPDAAEITLRTAVRALPASSPPADTLLISWTRARIAAEHGEPSVASDLLIEVREGFIELEMPWRAADATLEVASLLAERGALATVRQLASEALDLFRGLGLSQSQMAAALLLSRSNSARTVQRAARLLSDSRREARRLLPA